MSQYSLSTTDPLRKGSREQTRKIRLPWKVDNGVRTLRLHDIDVGAASLIFDAGTIDTKSSRANSKTFWSRKHAPDAGDDGMTPTQDQFSPPATVFGGTIFESPPVSRAGTADVVETRGPLSVELHAHSGAAPQTPTLARSQRGWKIPSPLFAFPRTPKGPAHADCEIEQQHATPTTPSALTRVFGIFSRR